MKLEVESMNSEKRMVWKRLKSVSAALLILGMTSVYATDGVWINSIGNGGNWTETNRWANGIIADGAGATADFGYINTAITMWITVNTNATLGTWLIGGYLDGNNQKYSFNTSTSSLTLDNGESPAIIANTHITKPNKEAYINVPVILNSDLQLKVMNSGGYLYMGRNISETGSPRSVTINAAPNGMSLLGSNTFSGPVVVQSGTLQLGGVDAVSPSGSPVYTVIKASSANAGFTSYGLGLSTSVTVTTSTSALDLRNAIVGSGKTLLIGGTGANANGTLINAGNFSPVFTGQWASAVSMVANASVGGSGNLLISGAISDNSSGYQLTKVGAGTLFLTATNSYSGGTILSAGLLNACATDALGAGPLIFNTGTFQFGQAFDLSMIRITNINNKVVNLNTFGKNVTLANALVGFNAGLSKVGLGTLTLSGANSFTSDTSVNQGVLALDYTAQNNSKLAASGLLMLNGSAVQIIGNASAFMQSINGLVINAGMASINNQSGNTALSVAGVTRNTGGVLDVVNNGGGLRTTTANVNGILGALTTVGGTDWAKNDANNIVALPAYNMDTFNATDNVDVTSNQTTSSSLVNALRFNTAAPVTLTFSGTLTNTSGGLLVTKNAGNNPVVITGGILCGASGKDLVVIQNNTNNTLTISSAISNNGNATALTKAGPGMLCISNSQSLFTGNVYLNGGTLAAYAPLDLGATNVAKTVYLNSGSTLQLYGTWTNGLVGITRALNVGADGAELCIPNVGDTITQMGAITYNYGATLRKSGAGTWRMVNYGAGLGTAGYPSTFILEGGAVDLAGLSISQLVPGGGTVVLKNGAVIKNGHQLLQGGSGNALNIMDKGGVIDLQNTVNLNQGNFLQGSGTLVVTNLVTGAQSLNLYATQNDFTGLLDLEFATNANGFNFAAGIPNGELRLGATVVANQTTTYSVPGQTEIKFGALSGKGRLNMGAFPVLIGDDRTAVSGFSGLIAGNGTLFKAGSGTWVLTGTNTYTGGTVIRGGSLLVNNTVGNATGAGPVTIMDQATLGGTGMIQGVVTNLPGGTLAPGDGNAGTLTMSNNLVLEAGSKCQFEIGQTTGDCINVASNLVISGTATLNLATLPTDPLTTRRTCTLIKYGGTVSGFQNLLIGIEIFGFKGILINNIANKSIDLTCSKPGSIISFN
jgi:autotransporter-associated beta strand protein